MRIAIVHSFYSESVPSGENTVVRAQAQALSSAGHEVRIVAAYTDELQKRTGYKYQAAANVIAGTGFDPLAELRQFDPDVVHVHNLFPNIATGWLSKWRKAIVSTVHNFRSLCAAGTLFRDGHECVECPSSSQAWAVVHRCYRDSVLATVPLAVRNRRGVNKDPLLARSDRLVFLSDRSCAAYTANGLSHSGLCVVPNFVEGTAEESGLRDGDLPSGAPWIYAGRLTPEKGIADLLSSWPAGVALDIYGQGPLLEKVLAQTSSTVRYKGNVSSSVLRHAMRNSMGLVFPSLWAEGFPTVYLEALQAGLPVVARRGNSAADDVDKSRTGVTYVTPVELSEALKLVTSDRRPFSKNAVDHFNSCYTKDVWVERIVDVYNQALRSRERP